MSGIFSTNNNNNNSSVDISTSSQNVSVGAEMDGVSEFRLVSKTTRQVSRTLSELCRVMAALYQAHISEAGVAASAESAALAAMNGKEQQLVEERSRLMSRISELESKMTFHQAAMDEADQRYNQLGREKADLALTLNEMSAMMESKLREAEKQMEARVRHIVDEQQGEIKTLRALHEDREAYFSSELQQQQKELASRDESHRQELEEHQRSTEARHRQTLELERESAKERMAAMSEMHQRTVAELKSDLKDTYALLKQEHSAAASLERKMAAEHTKSLESLREDANKRHLEEIAREREACDARAEEQGRRHSEAMALERQQCDKQVQEARRLREDDSSSVSKAHEKEVESLLKKWEEERMRLLSSHTYALDAQKAAYESTLSHLNERIASQEKTILAAEERHRSHVSIHEDKSDLQRALAASQQRQQLLESAASQRGGAAQEG